MNAATVAVALAMLWRSIINIAACPFSTLWCHDRHRDASVNGSCVLELPRPIVAMRLGKVGCRLYPRWPGKSGTLMSLAV